MPSFEYSFALATIVVLLGSVAIGTLLGVAGLVMYARSRRGEEWPRVARRVAWCGALAWALSLVPFYLGVWMTKADGHWPEKDDSLAPRMLAFVLPPLATGLLATALGIGRRRWLLAAYLPLSLLTVGWLALLIARYPHGADGPPPARPLPPLRRVEVEVLAPIQTIRGDYAPSHRPDLIGLATLGVDRYDVTVRFPDGRSVRRTVREVSIRSEDGVVIGVTLKPMLVSRPGPQARDELLRCLEEMGMPPDERMRGRIDQMPSYPPIHAHMDLPDDTSVEVSMWEAGDDRWVFSLSFHAAIETYMGLVHIPAGLAGSGRSGLAADITAGDAMAGDHGPARPVGVELGGRIEAVSGVALSDDVVERGSTLFVEGATALGVRLPSGGTLRLPARHVEVRTERGVVLAVYAWPLGRALPFDEAVGEARRALEAAGIEPSERMLEQVAGWPPDAPGYEGMPAPAGYEHPTDPPAFPLQAYPPTYIGRTPIGRDDGRVEVLIRPHPDGGWLTCLIFEASREARRKAEEANREAVEARVAGPKG